MQGQIHTGVKSQENSIHPFKREKTKDFIEIIGNIHFSFLFLHIFAGKNEREKKLWLENSNLKI